MIKMDLVALVNIEIQEQYMIQMVTMLKVMIRMAMIEVDITKEDLIQME